MFHYDVMHYYLQSIGSAESRPSILCAQVVSMLRLFYVYTAVSVVRISGVCDQECMHASTFLLAFHPAVIFISAPCAFSVVFRVIFAAGSPVFTTLLLLMSPAHVRVSFVCHFVQTPTVF